jgi:hypothetical protein
LAEPGNLPATLAPKNGIHPIFIFNPIRCGLVVVNVEFVQHHCARILAVSSNRAHAIGKNTHIAQLVAVFAPRRATGTTANSRASAIFSASDR